MEFMLTVVYCNFLKMLTYHANIQWGYPTGLVKIQHKIYKHERFRQGNS